MLPLDPRRIPLENSSPLASVPPVPGALAGRGPVVGPAHTPCPRVREAKDAAGDRGVIPVKAGSHDCIAIENSFLSFVAENGVFVRGLGTARVTTPALNQTLHRPDRLSNPGFVSPTNRERFMEC